VIVVVGSRHDSVSRSLATMLPGGALCGADDLTRPGWCWPLESPETARWVVEGKIVDDGEVSDVLVRRTYVYPEELFETHPDDREYLAAEATAFLVFVLSRTCGRVVNPVADGAVGDGAVRPERWTAAAVRFGMKVAPIRMRSTGRVRLPPRTSTVEVAAGQPFGGGSPQLRRMAVALADALGMGYVSMVFDGRGRLLTISTMTAPSAEAAMALTRLLEKRP
jgi:hypothetical protein